MSPVSLGSEIMTTQDEFSTLFQRMNGGQGQKCSISDHTNWTSSRCERILRPIKARIEVLRRNGILSRPTTVGAGGDFYDQRANPDISLHPRTHNCWSASSKRRRRTYHGQQRRKTVPRESRKGHLALQDIAGEDEYGVHDLRKSRGIDLAKSLPGFLQAQLAQPYDGHKPEKPWRTQSRYLARDGNAHYELAQELRTIRSRMDPAAFNVYNGLYNSLETLLKRTGSVNHNGGIPHKRKASLFSACLRQMPQCIRCAELWQASQHNDDLDNCGFHASRDLYSQLEQLGTSSDGWLPLRSIVRAHGVQVVGEAIKDGFINCRLSSALVMLCAHTESLLEAEILLDALLSRAQHRAPASVYDSCANYAELEAIVTLQDYVRYTGRTKFHHQQLQRLISVDILSTTWLITPDFQLMWNEVFRQVAASPSEPQAYALLETVLIDFAKRAMAPIGYRDARVPLEDVIATAFRSALVTLLSIHILNESSLRISRRETLHSLFMIVLAKSGSLDLARAVNTNASDRGEKLLAMSVVLSLPVCDYVGDVSRDSWPKDDLYKRILTICLTVTDEIQNDREARFLVDVATCCGKATSSDGHDYLKKMVTRIRCFADRWPLARSTKIKACTSDAAYMFAQQSAVTSHYEYAESLGAQMPSPYKAFPVGLNCSTKLDVGFRWEEGIGEWVAATPAVNRHDQKKDTRRTLSDVCDAVPAPSPTSAPCGIFNSRWKQEERSEVIGSMTRVTDLIPDSPGVLVSANSHAGSADATVDLTPCKTVRGIAKGARCKDLKQRCCGSICMDDRRACCSAKVVRHKERFVLDERSQKPQARCLSGRDGSARDSKHYRFSLSLGTGDSEDEMEI